ncbi:methyltransferase [Lentiprolixibacter aurantiacus]|uniref:Methyltransferase n=1 Tax=Lentiprolixibacter aurantiacus TaxID=2993939 RepID=A0AAE3MNN1_9FLAO|nr:methyltransferase [Lentiprolixibacter aurantiacus]MCX2720724.1 methyltransferase [Lentiprolixibacter aurantiacus]
MYEKSYPSKRYSETITFLEKHIGKPAHILDLGVENPFSDIMKERGYEVENTSGEDLDMNLGAVSKSSAEVVTAFEILEHMVAPFNVLKAIKTKKLVASVPLKLWFASAYRSKEDPWDRHYHEFEDWQFDWLLDKAGWEIKDRHKWTHPVKKIGLRPLLRWFTPRYYIVYAERRNS